jgi:hypothetical protein
MQEKDWTGNSRSTHALLGARNYAQNEREAHDYYATEPKALELLLEKETFDSNIWECACGEGHLAKVLEERGYNVLSTDLIDRGYGIGGVDFLKCAVTYFGDIITNPPYKYAKEFVEKALEIIPKGNKVAMFLKLQFLEGKSRRKMFEKYPPRYIYVSSSRLCCAMNGDFDKYSKSNAITYAWFIWEKGYTGEPQVRWFN